MCNNYSVIIVGEKNKECNSEQVVERFAVEFRKICTAVKVLGNGVVDTSFISYNEEEIDLETNSAYDNPKLDKVINTLIKQYKSRKITNVVICGENLSRLFIQKHAAFEREGIHIIILKSATTDDEYVSGSMFLIKANMNKSICIEHEEDGYIHAEKL